MPKPLPRRKSAPPAETRQRHVVDTLRSWAQAGKFDPSEKLSESALAEALDVSRTPVRHALAVLVEEGVLMRAGARGYHVRTYRVADVIEAIELRALLEGYAARKLAGIGLSPELRASFDSLLREGDAIFREGGDNVDEARYGAMNLAFHSLIYEASGVELVQQIRNLIDRIPFGTPDAIRFETYGAKARAQHLQLAHWQHHYIVAAMVEGDGARAEAIFREHGELIKVSLGLARGVIVPEGRRVQPLLDTKVVGSRLPRNNTAD